MVSVSVVIITHGREELLLKCLASLVPEVGLSMAAILVVNGLPLAEETRARVELAGPGVTVLNLGEHETPGKARNAALAVAAGDWLFFLDDDAHLTDDYWERALPLARRPDVDVFGGPDMPCEGASLFSLSLAIALSSPFCTGVTSARHRPLGHRPGAADEDKLTSCNLWVRRSALGTVRFPEDYGRAEETLFLQRLGQTGARMVYHPHLQVAHERRKNLRSLFWPTFRSGFYRSRLLREGLSAGGEVFWLPSVFVLCHGLALVDPGTFLDLVRIYGGIILCVSVGLAVKARRVSAFPLVAFLHWFIVFLYGVGFLAERMGFSYARFKRSL